jgi:lysophospholipid acyltransferase (LPLAT)-like uncharacterized protein
MNKLLFLLTKYLGSFVVFIIGITLDFNIKTPVYKDRAVFTFWHRNMIPLLFRHRFQKLGILISSSKDGEFIAGPAKMFGFFPIRGSSTRGGSKAVRQMLKYSKSHSLAISPDGPKGPSEQIKDGLLFLAYSSKLPIIPVAADVKQEKVFNSWDKFRLPKLFSTVNISYGEPIYIQSKDEIVSKQDYVQQKIDELTENNKIKNK